MLRKLINTLLICLVLLVPLSTYGQDYQAEFQRHCQTQDTVKQLEVLQRWESDRPDDAELYTSYFNYYFLKSRKEVVTLTTGEPGGQGFILKDSTGETAGFMGSEVRYSEAVFAKGIERIEAGIGKYPDRLDMRFGKIYAYGQKRDWQAFTQSIVATVAHSVQNNNQWTWTNNTLYSEGKEGFLSSLQDYQLQLYNTGDDALLIHMRTIASAVLEHYPDHVESLSNIAITYLLAKEYDEAIQSLKKAEQIAPEDFIILSNIARGYQLKGDKEMAIAYYQKTAQYGDARAKAFAQEQIEELQNNK